MKKLLILLIITLLILFGIFFVCSCAKDNSSKPEFPLSGTEWLLYQYTIDGTSIIFNRTDTLKFSDNFNYTYNNISSTYSLSYNPSTCSLLLYGTIFGDISGIIPYEFISYGEINGDSFSNIYTSKKYFLWLKKLK